MTAGNFIGSNLANIEEIVAGPGITLTGDVTLSNLGVLSLNEDYIMMSCLNWVIDKQFYKKSEDFKLKVKNIFTNKKKEEYIDIVVNTFSNDGMEFFDDMTDEEILNYLRISY